jgi:hypothetical protein
MGKRGKSKSHSKALKKIKSFPSQQNGSQNEVGLKLTPSSIGGGSIFSSLFGNEPTTSGSNNNIIDLFSSSQAKTLQNKSEERMKKNEIDLNENDTMQSKCYEGRDEIIRQRRESNSSQRAKDVIDAISVSLPETAIDDDEATKNGVIRLFCSQADSIMRKKGVLIIKNDGEESNDTFFEQDLLVSMTKQAQQIECDICEKLSKEGKTWQIEENGMSKSLKVEKDYAFRYQEVSSRCLGRLDIRYGMDQPPFTNKSIVTNKYLLPMIQSLLGRTAKLVYAGLILSFPESSDQPWHQDGAALFDDNDGFSSETHLPPYALNVFVPLDKITEEIGPTEFHVGSHFTSAAKKIMQSFSSDGKSNNISEGAIGPLLDRGDVLIYDYRICHRGTRNLSENKTRPMLYLMYARPWFHEHLNFGETKLFRK